MKTALLRFGLPTGIAVAMLALAAVPIGVAGSRDDKSSPTSQFLTAYNSISMADWLEEKGLRAEATDLYTEALNLLLKVSADYPQWQPAVVSFRINYCRGALGSVERKATTDPPTPRRYGGQAPDDSLPTVAPRAKAGRPTAENQKSEIENRKCGPAARLLSNMLLLLGYLWLPWVY